MLLQSAAIGAETLLLDDKEICLLGVVCKVSSRKTLSGETFYFPEKRLLSTLHFVLPVTYYFFWFYEVLIGRPTTFLECIVIVL